MAEFKRGDKVRVSFEAEVITPGVGNNGEAMVVIYDGYTAVVPNSSISPVPPPHEYKPGDKVLFKDGTEGEIYKKHDSVVLRNGFVPVRYQPIKGVDAWNYMHCPIEELTPIQPPRPAPPAGMPPYWIDVYENPDDDYRPYHATIYRVSSGSAWKFLSGHHTRSEAYQAALNWIRQHGGVE